MRNTFAEMMREVGVKDPRLVVLVGDISHFALQPFAKACPGRYYNVGILEPTIISVAAGLASTGFWPVVHTIAPFIVERGFEQIKLDFCYQELGGTLVSVGSAFDYSQLGCTHHCYDDIALIKALPNTQIVYPAMPAEFRELFRQTFGGSKLTYFRLPGRTHGVRLPTEQMELGKGILVRPGRDITLIGAGPQLGTVAKAAEALASRGTDAEILYFPTIKPLDAGLLTVSISKTRCVLVVEEHSVYGGLADDVLRATRHLSEVRFDSVNIGNQFIRDYGTYDEICVARGFSAENVVSKSLALLGR